MALTVEENELITHVAPGTPCGEMMRRYWHPIGLSAELKGRPLRRRLLGEDLVVFRDDQGRVGLLTLRCSHRGTSLEFGHVEDGGIRCCYHGWLYDVDGKVLQMPGEPPDSTFKDRIRQKAYKAQEAAGIIFAYIGPEPAPLLPRWDVLVREDGARSLAARVIHCNYLQTVENSVDQHHFKWLHRTPKTRFWTDEKLTSEITEFGIRDTFTRTVPDGTFMTVSHFLMPNMNKVGYHLNEDHPAAFAATHEGYEALRWRVPDRRHEHDALYSVFRAHGQRQSVGQVPKGPIGAGFRRQYTGQISLGRRNRLDRARRSGPLCSGKPRTGLRPQRRAPRRLG